MLNEAIPIIIKITTNGNNMPYENFEAFEFNSAAIIESGRVRSLSPALVGGAMVMLLANS